MSSAGSWPRWSLDGEPAALAKYVLPDEVAALLHLPGPPADSRLGQAQAVYEALSGAGITYAHEEPSDDPDRQVIRQPGEVLWCPKHATCLDLALILAGACLHSGLHPLVLILDPPEPGGAAHALLGVWIDDLGSDDSDGIQIPDMDVWANRPGGFDELVQTDPTGPWRPLLLLDPIGVAQALPSSPILGTSAAFTDAARAGARYAREWTWRLAVDIGRAWHARDTHAPADRPDDQPLRPPYVALDPLVHRPLQVLQAEHAVVPFQARDELTILTDWCRTAAAGPYTGIAVIHGVGGAGKSRLALELAHQLATRDGWYTGYLREGATGRDWLGTVVSPTLIVLDYADARTADAEHLLTILKRRVDRGAAPAIVIMTARAINGQWLTTLRRTWNRDGHLVRERDPLHLPPEHPAGAAIFRRAARIFHQRPDTDLDLEAADQAAPADWTTLDYILLALLAARSPDQLPTTREELYEEVLAHERTYWTQTYNRFAGLPKDADAPLDVLNRSVASLTLRAPTTRKEVHAALRAVEELRDDTQWRETVRTTLTTCLQPGPGEPLVLRPDPIADHLTLHELHDDGALLTSILDGLEGYHLLSALRQLNRAAAAAPDSTTDMVTAWVSARTDRWKSLLPIAMEQGGTALSALHRLIDEDPAVPWLGELSSAIPLTSIGLPELGLHADLRRLSILRADDTSQPANIAAQLQRVGLRQYNVGDRRAALASITEAIDYYRTLAKTDRNTNLPDLADGLCNLAVQQSEAGDRRAAVASITEAISYYRTLAKTDPTTHLPDLAISLNNLAVQQGEAGDRRAAVASITEAIEYCRTLAKTAPTTHLPILASSLYNLAIQQRADGDREGALASNAEAVGYYRTLVKTDPATHLPNLTKSLYNLANRQGDIGDREGALASITKAVNYYRALAKANPAVHLPNLAMSLNNLAVRQSKVGDQRAAVASITEAVGYYRTLVKTDPDTHLPNLANSLYDLAARQSKVGDQRAAVASITEAVEYYRTLAKTDPDTHLPNLGDYLNKLAILQSKVGDQRAALASITEAVDYYRTLAKTDPDTHLPDLADSLNRLARRQTKVGDHEAALTSNAEAVGYYRALAQADRATYLPNLADSLNILAARQSEVGDQRAALASITEAVGYYRTLAKTDPDTHLPDLADGLNDLAVQQSEVGDQRAALASITEAVGYYRTLAKTDPDTHLPDLADGLNNLAIRQSEVGDQRASLVSHTEAVGYYRTLAKTDPDTHLPKFAMCLKNLARRQSKAGDQRAAVASITEAVGSYRTLAKTDPDTHLPDLADSLNDLAIRQSEVGDQRASLVSHTEAVAYQRTLTQTNPAVHLPNFAMYLKGLAIQQSEVGDQRAALASITEAVDYYHALAQVDLATYLPKLADSLNDLAVQQGEVGDHEAALASQTKAIDYYHALAQVDLATYLPKLADSLNNLAVQQGEVGDHEAALASQTKAVDYCRTLADADRATHLPNLAMYLNNLAIRQSEVGDQRAALASITEAVDYYRTLTKANSAVYFPNLAGSLYNLAIRQSGVGDQAAALTSITEAVDYYCTLAETDSDTHLPNLAICLNKLADLQNGAKVPSAAWEEAIIDLELSPLAQAELRVHYSDYLVAHADVALAVEQLVRAALACAVGDPSSLSRARQQVRSTVTSLGIQDPRLPNWARDPLPDDVVELLNQWAKVAGWSATEAFLRAHAERLLQPDFRHHLELAAALFPHNPAIDNLTVFLGQADTEGFDIVLDRGRAHYEVPQLLREWVATPSWAESRDFLEEHGSKLRTREVQALLAGTDAPSARLHLAILQLTETLTYDEIYEIVTDRDVAIDQAFTAVDQADVPFMHRVLDARPDVLTGITGAFFATVSAAAHSDSDQARQHAEAIAEHGTDIQRRAYAIRLRTLARLAPTLSNLGELAELIQPDEH
ncbi:tetratricopeptide repeat protein [Catellatospora chokoriensis]|uniref:tetratricopeptide repeat protein n=1 Tax=Catellatospora chokoriensis TaxID=310353 RepID=UPI00177E1022|nr:tetratricopeptide repeat protein [Catellatospora chokoriensis]